MLACIISYVYSNLNLILFVSSTVTDTAAMPEPTTTPVKKRTSHVQKRDSSPAKKNTRKGHVRKLSTTEDPPKKDKSKLMPKKGETRKGMNHCGRRTRGKNTRNRRYPFFA